MLAEFVARAKAHGDRKLPISGQRMFTDFFLLLI
jgi:hypothetical protein